MQECGSYYRYTPGINNLCVTTGYRRRKYCVIVATGIVISVGVASYRLDSGQGTTQAEKNRVGITTVT